ncbi:MAG: hypothetical protein Kow0077_10370 [Anaerolineae bacterium]
MTETTPPSSTGFAETMIHVRRFLLSGHTSLTTRPAVARKAPSTAHWRVGDRVTYQQGARAFQVEDVLSGGMGVVYVVTDVETDDPFVIKTIRDQYATHSELVARFRREAEAWITLGKHPNIVQARGFELLEGRPHLMLEYVSGGSVRTLFARQDLDVPQVLDLAIQIARGMRYAASRGINAHRDLKPDNILMTSNRIAKVTDFGLVKFYADEDGEDSTNGWANDIESLVTDVPLTSVSGRGMGTKDYMSPEQWQDAGTVDIRSDIYSFGVMLYEMLTRIRPFYGKSRSELREKHLKFVPPPLSTLRPDIPASVDRFVARCIEKSPARRFQSFVEVEQELTRIIQKEFRQVVRLLNRDQLSVAEMNERGAAFFNLGRHSRALVCFDQVIRMDSAYALAWANRGVALAELGQYEAAIASFDHALQLDPENAVVYMNKALTLIELEQYEDAHYCLERSVRLNPLLEDAWRIRAELLNRLTWFEPAYYSAYRARTLDPLDVQAWEQEAVALMGLGHLQQAAEAVAAWERLVGTRHPRVLLFRARIAVAHANHRHALLLTAAVPPDAPEYREALQLGMESALELGYMDEIAVHSEDMLRVGLGEDALRLLLEALDRAGNQSAVELVVLACDTAFAVGDFVVAWHLYRRWQADRLRVDESLTRVVPAPQISHVILRDLHPDSPQQSLALGQLLEAVGKPELAARYLRQGLSATPDRVMAWMALYRVCQSLEDAGGALAAAEQLVRLRPTDFDSWLNLAEAALRFGEYPRVLDATREAHKLGPETALSLFLYGAALAGQGQHNLAIRYYERALDHDERFSVAWWNLCLSLWQLRRIYEARRAMVRARVLDSRMWERVPYETPPFLPVPLSNDTYLARKKVLGDS